MSPLNRLSTVLDVLFLPSIFLDDRLFFSAIQFLDGNTQSLEGSVKALECLLPLYSAFL